MPAASNTVTVENDTKQTFDLKFDIPIDDWKDAWGKPASVEIEKKDKVVHVVIHVGSKVDQDPNTRMPLNGTAPYIQAVSRELWEHALKAKGIKGLTQNRTLKVFEGQMEI